MKSNYPMKEETFENIKKNGIPLEKEGYKIGPILEHMSRDELIEEILGSFEYDYLLENNMVVYDIKKTRDNALSVLNKHGFAWKENPLHPNHDRMTHANGDDLTEDEEAIWLDAELSNGLTHAVWDLCNIWAMSDERQALVEEYAKNCKFN